MFLSVFSECSDDFSIDVCGVSIDNSEQLWYRLTGSEVELLDVC